MTRKAPIRTMADLLAALPGLGYSASMHAQVRASIKKCERIYNAPLARIPADLQAFEQAWGRGRFNVEFTKLGFKQKSQFEAWRKRVRGALARISTAETQVEILPEWTALIDCARKHGGVGRALPPHLDKSLSVVARSASRDERAPAQLLDGDWIDAAAAQLKGAQRRSFKCGIRALNTMIERRADLPCQHVAALLPNAALPQPQHATTRASSWRRGNGAHVQLLWQEFDAFVAHKRGVDALGRPMPAEHSGFSDRAVRTYETALTSATGLLERAGDLWPGDAPGLADICNSDTIGRIANLWSLRVIEGEVSAKACTRHLLIARLAHIAEFFIGCDDDGRERLAHIRRELRKATPAHNSMSLERKAWIEEFASDPARQRQLHRMPELLLAHAKPIVADWEALKRRRERKKMMEAMHLGIAAVQAAILFRASPLRARNLRELVWRGTDAELQFRPDGSVHLTLAAERVKNARAINAAFDTDALEALSFYCDEVRPRLVSDHPYGHKLSDSDFLFPGKSAAVAMEETVFADHYRRGCQHVGVDMTLHLARHICAFLILDADANAIAEASAVLGDAPETVRRFYAWLDERKAETEGRELLRGSRAAAFKNKKGIHNA